MRWILMFIFLSITVFFILSSKPKQQEQDFSKLHSNPDHRRKVIWIMADSLMSQAIDQGIKSGDLPAFSFLISHGHYQKEVISSFPTMSVTVDSTLITGAHPDRHHIPGLIWFDNQEQRIVNYGTGLNEILRDGLTQAAEDMVQNLNHKHLNQEIQTIFEALEERGIRTGSINGLIYRGSNDHKLAFPSWVAKPLSLPDQVNVKAPDFFALGMFANPLQGKVSLPDGLTKEFGFKDAYSVEATKYLIKNDLLPDFLFVYLPDLDKPLHKKGPGPQEKKAVQKLDREIAELLDSFGSWNEAIQHVTWVVCGDGGQTSIVPSNQNPVVQLDQLLNNYQVLKPGQQPSEKTEVALAVNERSAFVYALKQEISLNKLADQLKKDDRVDILAWKKENGWIQVFNAEKNTEMQFRPGQEFEDSYHQKWDMKGDLKALDLTVKADKKQISYGDYPDALIRLWTSFHSHSGRYLIITARPGYELADVHSPTHKGGAGHGSLHQIDSVAPMIITGTDQRPAHWRLVDMKPWILSLFDSPTTESKR